jgi:hypothetical protein
MTTLNVKPSGQVQGDATATPSVSALTLKTVTETQTIPYQTTTQNDPTLPSGQTTIQTQGTAGTRTLTYSVGYKDGQEASRQLLSNVITMPPVNEVIAIGIDASSSATSPTQPLSPSSVPPLSLAFVACPNAVFDVCIHTLPQATLSIDITYCGHIVTSDNLLGPFYAHIDGTYLWSWKPTTQCNSDPTGATAAVTATWPGEQPITQTNTFAIPSEQSNH